MNNIFSASKNEHKCLFNLVCQIFWDFNQMKRTTELMKENFTRKSKIAQVRVISIFTLPSTKPNHERGEIFQR